MQEFSVPVIYAVKPDDNVTDDVFANAENWPDAAGFKRKVKGTWTPVTWREFAGQVRGLAAGFIAAGIQPGDRVALMSRTRFEWTLADYAILAAGGVTVPIYPTSSLEQVEWILGDSGAVAVVAETDDHAGKVAAARAGLPALAPVWQIDGSRFGGLPDLTARGAQVRTEQVEERRRTRGAADLAEIVYTSGTTGRPKGCMLSHGNLVANARNCMENDGFKRSIRRARLDAAVLAAGAQLRPAHPVRRHLLAHRVGPGRHGGRRRRVAGVQADGGAVGAAAVGKGVPQRPAPGRRRRSRQDLRPGGGHRHRLQPGAGHRRSVPALRLEHALFDRLVYARLRAALGGKVRYSWSAAAPLSPQLGHFFRGCGITILEGYGMTETSPATNSNTPDAQKIGTVGQPIPGCTIRIAPDDEVLVKGPMVFQGYWNNPGATKEMIDQDGWLHTGDLGALDDEGFLAITGRKKDLIITASGKNVAPAVIEDRLRAHWLVSQCLVVGDARPFIGALVAVDPETFAQWKADHGKPPTAAMADLRGDPALRAEIQAAIDEANKAVSHAEAIKKFAILGEDFTEAGGQLTATLKLRRHVIMEQYANQIAALYDDRAS